MIYTNFSKRQILTMTWWCRPQFQEYDGILCDGSVRSGKTVSMGIGFMLWSMNSFDGKVFGICGKTIESLRRNVVSLMPQWFEGIYNIKEKRSENKMIVTDGRHTNTYYLFGGKDESSYSLVQGITFAGALMDEVVLMPRSFVEQVVARCSVAGSKLWFNCNPDGPSHWFYHEWVKGAEQKNVIHLHFTMDDNLSLDPKIKARYENLYSGVFYSRYILGLWVKAEGLVYPMFDKKIHVSKTQFQYSLRHRYYVSIDYGTVNPFAAGLYDVDPINRKATMVRELYYKGGSVNRVDNEAYYKMLVELIGDLPIEYIIIDPSASSMVETINKYAKYAVVKADNDVINGIQDVTKFLNSGVLFFDRSCKSTFEEFESYSWDEESVEEDKVIKENDHSMDQIRYFCRTVLRPEFGWMI